MVKGMALTNLYYVLTDLPSKHTQSVKNALLAKFEIDFCFALLLDRLTT